MKKVIKSLMVFHSFRSANLIFTWLVVYNASYKIKSCLLLKEFMFSCCFHLFLNNFFVPPVDVNRGTVGVQVSNVDIICCTMILDGSPFTGFILTAFHPTSPLIKLDSIPTKSWTKYTQTFYNLFQVSKILLMKTCKI